MRETVMTAIIKGVSPATTDSHAACRAQGRRLQYKAPPDRGPGGVRM